MLWTTDESSIVLCSHKRYIQLAVLQRTCSTSNNSFPLVVMNSFRVVFCVERLPKNRQRTERSKTLNYPRHAQTTKTTLKRLSCFLLNAKLRIFNGFMHPLITRNRNGKLEMFGRYVDVTVRHHQKTRIRIQQRQRIFPFLAAVLLDT